MTPVYDKVEKLFKKDKSLIRVSDLSKKMGLQANSLYAFRYGRDVPLKDLKKMSNSFGVSYEDVIREYRLYFKVRTDEMLREMR